MIHHDYPYLDMLDHVMRLGVPSEDRTGTGTRKVWGCTLRFDLQEGFPLLTTKKLHWKSIAYELLFFMNGFTNNKWLTDRGVRIWNEWARPDGELGPVYGAQWRKWKYPVLVEGHAAGIEWVDEHYEIHEIDQLQNSLDMLRNNPNSRQNVVTAWNPGELKQMALPPCHLLFQWQVMEGRLNCALYQRSCDAILGVPFNIASYSLLTHIMATMAGLEVGELLWVGADVHIYNNHVDQVEEQLSRHARPSPQLKLNATRDKFEDWQFEDFELVGYNPHPAIKAKVSV